MTIQNQDALPTELDKLFERSILDLGIPSCPIILNRFMIEIRKDEPDYVRLESIIESDVSLAGGLIKTANAPYFGLRKRARSVKEALIMLGLKTSSQAIAGIILHNSFPSVHNLDRFWDASARIARLSSWLAQRLKIQGLGQDDAYTYGLFRDCGIPVLLGHFKNYPTILNTANHEEKLSFTEIEEIELPTNHAMVGCILAQSWWLPEEIFLAIRNHHSLAALESTDLPIPLLSRRLIAISQLAELIIQQQLDLSQTREWSKLGAACLKYLNLVEGQLDELFTEASPIVADMEQKN
jgi:HD-like signal output (HDOD) protein